MHLQQLHFCWDGTGESDLKNVKRLKEALTKDCRRLDARNHVPAVIDSTDLDNALGTSGLSLESLLRSGMAGDYLELTFQPGFRLECRS